MTDDIALTLETNSNGSADDPNRREMLWKARPEELIGIIRDQALITSRAHGLAGAKARHQFQLIGLAMVVLPLSAAVASDYAPPEVNSALMLLAGICAGCNQVLNFGSKNRHHYEFEAKYADLASNITFEMAKSRSDRVAADMFLESIRVRTAALRASEPPL